MYNTFVTLSYFLILFTYYPVACDNCIQLDSSNIDSFIANNEITFINFYADWCRFSQMLAPIWSETAQKIAASSGRNVVGKVDCDKHGPLCARFSINKYPSIKYSRNGMISRREYRGGRTADAFVSFLEDQMKDPVKQINNFDELHNTDKNIRHIIGCFDVKTKEESSIYEHFRRSAMGLRDDCVFYACFGDTADKCKSLNAKESNLVLFRPNTAITSELDETFSGDLTNFDALNVWAAEKCSPLVKEITFENAEELTEDGLPFLILFYNPDDKSSIKKYNDVIQRELLSEKSKIMFVTADGNIFAHPLHHLGKSAHDLPIIAIDSFKHMYVFSQFSDINIPGKLQKFVQDLHSGKLHREFHYGLDVDSESSTPPESQFQHLGPSKNRYTFKHDEF